MTRQVTVITPNAARALRREMRFWFRRARNEIFGARLLRASGNKLEAEDAEAALVRASHCHESAQRIIRELNAATVRKYSAWAANDSRRKAALPSANPEPK